MLKLKWHRFWSHYYQLLLEGCLDYELKLEINRKIQYHNYKQSA